MRDLASDPRTAQAYAGARSRASADPQLGCPDAVGPATDLLLQTLGPAEAVHWISWAFELREGPVQWWAVALTADRLLGVSPTPAPQVWASPVGSWSAQFHDGDVVLHLPAGAPLRVRGAGPAAASFGAPPPPPPPSAPPAWQQPTPASAAPVADLDAEADPDLASGPAADAVVSTWQEAEALARWHMQKLGFADAALTPGGADGGLDVAAAEAAAQVKHYANAPIGSPAVQQLRGAATGKDWALFYAWSGYTRSAVDFAESAKVALFRYDDRGVVEPASSAARHLMERVGMEGSPSIDEFELERETKAMAKQFFDISTKMFFDVVRQAVERRVPGSPLAQATDVEMARVKAIMADLSTRTLPLKEFLTQVERINDASVRLAEDVRLASGA